MSSKPKLYVDANLKITKSLYSRKAIVNKVRGYFEITFLKPIAHKKDLSEAWKERCLWHQMYHTSYPAYFPRVESCLFANEDEKSPLFKSCYTSSDYTDYHGRRDFWYIIDSQGTETAYRGGVLENVYISILLTHDEFFRINPWADISPYGFSEIL